MSQISKRNCLKSGLECRFFINFGTWALGCTRQKKGSLKTCSTEFMNFQYVKRPIADICHEKKILETFVKSFSPYLICLLGNFFQQRLSNHIHFPKKYTYYTIGQFKTNSVLQEVEPNVKNATKVHINKSYTFLKDVYILYTIVQFLTNSVLLRGCATC